MKKYLLLITDWLIKIFLVGLLLQFFLQTFVTYRLGQDGSFRRIVWMWKEIIILILLLILGVCIWSGIKSNGWKEFYTRIKKSTIWHFVIFFISACIISFILALLVQKIGLGTYILSIKYDFLGFLIFLIGAGLVRYLPLEDNKYETRYYSLLKFVVYGGIFWWLMLYLVPGTLRLFGYSRTSFEGTIGGNPPAVYYTEINRGLVRNQFLFERPINFGFFLIAFWPVFALGYLRKQTRKYQIWWTIAFGALVFSTLSRAAMGVWIIESAVILLLVYRKYAKKILLYGGIPALIICIAGMRVFKDVFMRTHSNTGHIVLLEEGIGLGMKKPVTGWGVGYSGPASHQLCYEAEDNERCDIIKEINTKYEISTFGYNPENQYVQIFMEYGILGLIPWLLCFGWLIWEGLKVIGDIKAELKKGKKVDQKKLSQLFLIFGFGLGLSGLAIEGLVLHSFVDRMIVYPFMLLYGLVRGRNNYDNLDEK